MMVQVPVGVYCEGTEWIIMEALLPRIIDSEGASFQIRERETRGGAFKDLVSTLPKILHGFYKQCVAFAIVCVDNDGKRDLMQPNAPGEDPKHPRHCRHVGQHVEGCRYCILSEKVEQTRSELRYLPSKDGLNWPIIVTVPVEEIESWLMTARFLVERGQNPSAENLPAKRAKREFYGKPFVTTHDVRSKAIALLENPALDLNCLADMSPSFRLFFDAIRSVDLF